MLPFRVAQLQRLDCSVRLVTKLGGVSLIGLAGLLPVASAETASLVITRSDDSPGRIGLACHLPRKVIAIAKAIILQVGLLVARVYASELVVSLIISGAAGTRTIEHRYEPARRRAAIEGGGGAGWQGLTIIFVEDRGRGWDPLRRAVRSAHHSIQRVVAVGRRDVAGVGPGEQISGIVGVIDRPALWVGSLNWGQACWSQARDVASLNLFGYDDISHGGSVMKTALAPAADCLLSQMNVKGFASRPTAAERMLRGFYLSAA